MDGVPPRRLYLVLERQERVCHCRQGRSGPVPCCRRPDSGRQKLPQRPNAGQDKDRLGHHGSSGPVDREAAV